MVLVLGGGRTSGHHVAAAVCVREGDGGGHGVVGEVVRGEDGGHETAVARGRGQDGLGDLGGGLEGVHLDTVGA